MIKIIRTRMVKNELVEFEDTYYDFKDIVVDDITMCLKSMGRDESEINNCLLDIDEIIEQTILMSDTYNDFDEIQTAIEYEEFRDEMIEHLRDTY